MNSDIGEQFKQAIIDGFRNAFNLFWSIKEVKNLVISSVVGIIVYIISFRIVGVIMSEGRKYDIWFGSLGGKLLYKGVSTVVGVLIAFITYRLVK